MRKRNKPFLLATLLVVFVGAAVGMNVAMAPKTPDEHGHEEEKPHEEPSPLGAARKEDNSKSASAAAAALASPDGLAKATPSAAPERGEAPKMSIVRQKASDYKPTPNDSSTSAHWYTKEFGVKDHKSK